MDLQSPSVLAQLPRPLHASTGKTRIGEVYRLADSKKRKRYELAVAVDGEGVNIYNIQTPKLVTSYAVPPQSSFSCEPCSVRRKLSNHKVKRQTYVAVNPQREIKSFVEEHNGSSAPSISSASFSVKDSDSPTIFVGIIPTSAAEANEEVDPFELLAVHLDGRVRRLAAGLDSQRWSLHHTELAKLSSTREIHSCFLVEFEDARKSLFKKRQDLAALALGDLTDSGVDQPTVLLLVSHPKGSSMNLNEAQVHMFSVPTNAPSQSLNLDESQKMTHLLTVSIPEIEGQGKLPTSSLEWDFHPASAGLNLSFDKGFVNFDLSQYSPAVTSKFIQENEQFTSVMRISPQSVIGAGSEIIGLFDTQYNSIQRSIPVKELPTNGDNRKAPTVFIGYFAKLGLAVATKGNALIAFDLSTSRLPSGSSLKRPRDGLLIDAIGRGIASSSPWDSSKKLRTEYTTALGFTSQEQTDKWNKLANDLRKSSQSKDTAAFDRAVQEYFDNGLPPTDQYVNSECILFLCSFMFSLQDADAANTDKLASTSSVRISIDFWPEATCNWLVERGALSPANAEIALRRAVKPRILPQLPAGAFTQALIDSDPTFDRLIAVLKSAVLIPSADLVHALRTFITTARSHYLDANEEDAPKALTNGDEPSTSALTSTGPAPLETIFYGLNTTLTKLNSFPLRQLTTSIRSALSRSEIISLVHHLRLCLATGGYTSRFTENPPTPVSQFQTTPPLSLGVIVNLLNASVDAISPSGWISAGLTDDDSEHSEMELITDLKSEISAALAGVEETAYLKGILREYLSYTDSVQRSISSKKKSADEDRQKEETASTLVRYEKLNGADLMVFPSVDDLEGYEGDPTGKLLPLSLKAPSNDVSRTKVKKSTGEVKMRSSREIGHLRRKAAGKYSFERLIV